MSQQGMCEHWMFRKSADFAKILFHHPLTNCQSAAWSILMPPHFRLAHFKNYVRQLFTVECQPFQCRKQNQQYFISKFLSSTKRSWKIRRSIVLTYLKNSSRALLDLTRSEWFLPRWRSELLLRRKSLNDLTKTKDRWRSGSKKKVSKTVSSGISSLRSDATGKILKGEETPTVGEVLRYSATCPLLCCYSDLAGPEAGKHLDAGSATATCCNNKCTSFHLATRTKGTALHLCSGRCWSIKFCLTRRGRWDGFNT